MSDIIKYEEKLKEISLIDDKDRKMILNLVPVFDELQLGMSGAQIEFGVLQKKEFPEDSHKFWQAALEEWVRFNRLISRQYEYTNLQAEILEAEAEIEKAEHYINNGQRSWTKKKYEAKKMRAENDIKMKEYNLQVLRKTIKEDLREIWEFQKCMSKYGKNIVNQEESKKRWLKFRQKPLRFAAEKMLETLNKPFGKGGD